MTGFPRSWPACSSSPCGAGARIFPGRPARRAGPDDPDDPHRGAQHGGDAQAGAERPARAALALGVRSGAPSCDRHPTALPASITGVMLGVARVIGETAPLLLLLGGTDSINTNLFSGRRSALRSSFSTRPVGRISRPGPRLGCGPDAHRARHAAQSHRAGHRALHQSPLTEDHYCHGQTHRRRGPQRFLWLVQGRRRRDDECGTRSVTAFIGPSGCGKSTFLRTLNRMHE